MLRRRGQTRWWQKEVLPARLPPQYAEAVGLMQLLVSVLILIRVLVAIVYLIFLWIVRTNYSTADRFIVISGDGIIIFLLTSIDFFLASSG